MRTKFKQITKKTLSCILALAVILCSVSVMFSVFATNESETVAPYTVSYRSPAIPMFTGKVVNFADIEVAFSDTVTANGTDVEWALNTEVLDDDNVILMSNCVYAAAAGKTCLTATYGEYTQNVWVIANEADNYTFNLVNLDLSTDFVKEDWVYGVTAEQYTDQGYAPNNYSASVVYGATQRSSLNIAQNWNTKVKMVLYRNEVLMDFSDYTVSAKISSESSDDGTKPLMGIIARAEINPALFEDDGTISSSATTLSLVKPDTVALLARMRMFGGLNIYGYVPKESTATTVSNINYQTTLHTLSDASVLKYNNADPAYVLNTKTIKYADGTTNSGKERSMVLKLSGNDIIYTLDKNIIFDSTAETFKTMEFSNYYDYGYHATDEYAMTTVEDPDTIFTDGTMTKESYNSVMNSFGNGKGTIGFTWCRGFGLNVKTLSVSLNDIVDDTDLPKMSDPEFYTVTDEDPVIPMTAGTKINVGNFFVNVDGELVLGKEFTWATTADATCLEVDGNYICAYKKGAYALTATKGETVKNVYAIVKNPDDSEYVVFENDYSSSTVYDEETGMYKARENYDSWDVVSKMDSYLLVNYTNVTTSQAGYEDSSWKGKNAHAGMSPYNYKTLKSDLYTAYDTAAGNTTATTDDKTWKTAILLNDDIVSKLTNYTITADVMMDIGIESAVGLIGRSGYDTTEQTLNTYGYVIKGSSAGYTLPRSQNTVGVLKGTGTSSLVSASYHPAWVYNTDFRNAGLHTYVLDFKGDTMTYSSPDVPGNSKIVTTGVAQTAGTVGIGLHSKCSSKTSPNRMGQPSIYRLKVALNNVDNVDALLAEPIENSVVEPSGEFGYVEITEGEQAYTLGFVENDEGGYSVSSYTDPTDGLNEKVTIPATYNGLPVTRVTEDAFKGNTNIKEIVFETDILDGKTVGVMNLGPRVFQSCVRLESVKLPSTLERIGAGAFQYCYSLRGDLILPASLDYWYNNYGFRDCVSITKVTVLGAMVPYYTFYGCISLVDVNFSGTQTLKIGDYAFNGCKSLTEISLPSHVSFEEGESNGANVASTFRDCVNLKSINIPTANTKLGANFFNGDAKLTSIVLPLNILSIDATTFTGCTGLKEIKIYNPECVIPDDAIPANEGLIIYGYADSTAKTYAYKYGITFVEETVPEYEYTNEDIIKEVAYSFLRKHDKGYIHYDQKTNNARRFIAVSPEEATAQRRVYLDCSSYVNACYTEAFGVTAMGIPVTETSPNTLNYVNYAKNNPDNPDVVGYWENADYTTDVEKTVLLSELSAGLQIGDLIAYRHQRASGTSAGHVYIYVGDGVLLHCYSGGSYIIDEEDPSLSHDDYDDTKSVMGKVSVSAVFGDSTSSRYLFKATEEDTVTSFAILRPFERNLTPTDESVNRMNVAGLDMEKTSSVYVNSSVDTGDTITYTVTLENTNGYPLVNVELTDVIPSGTEFVSGSEGVTVTDGNLSWKDNISGSTTVVVTYTVRVTATTGGTLIVSDDTYVSGVKLAKTTHTVSAYSASQRDLLARQAQKYIANSTSFESSYAFAMELYKSVLGVKVCDHETAVDALADIIDEDNLTYNKDSVLSEILVPSLYGGWYIRDGYRLNNDNERTRLVNKEELAVGDIVLADWNGGHVVYVYIGDSTLVTVQDGVCKALTIGDDLYSSDDTPADNILISLFGYNRFAVLRPSMKSYQISLNSRVDITDFIADGYTITVSSDTNAAVLVNNKLIALSEGTATVSLDNGTTSLGIVFTVVAFDADNDNNFINSDKVTISATETDGIYNLKIAEGVKVDYSQFKINGLMAYLNETDDASGIKSGRNYLLYTVADASGENIQYYLDTLNVTIAFEDESVDVTSKVYALGATIPKDTNNLSLRFINRTSALKRTVAGTNDGIELSSTITVDGIEYNAVGIGAMLIPTILLGGEPVRFADVADYTKEEVELSCGQTAKNVNIQYLNDSTSLYSDYAVLLKNLDNSIDIIKDLKISLVNYIVYKDAEGNIHIEYTGEIDRSYNGVSDMLLSYPNGKLPESLKVLALGNSYSEDATKYLWDICKAAGVEEVVIANMYISGCSLDTHWENITGDVGAYTYYKNTNGTWEKQTGVKISTALAEEDWDVVTVQQASWSSGIPSDYGNLENIVDYIYENEQGTKIMWHQTWARSADNVPSVYDGDQMSMYTDIVTTIQSKVETVECIRGIIPVGTAIQNMRSSYIGDTLHRDEAAHLSYDYGRYTAAMTWFAKITGCSIDNINWVPESQESIITDLRLVREAVTNALKQPYSVTPSKYK